MVMRTTTHLSGHHWQPQRRADYIICLCFPCRFGFTKKVFLCKASPASESKPPPPAGTAGDDCVVRADTFQLAAPVPSSGGTAPASAGTAVAAPAASPGPMLPSSAIAAGESTEPPAAGAGNSAQPPATEGASEEGARASGTSSGPKKLDEKVGPLRHIQSFTTKHTS